MATLGHVTKPDDGIDIGGIHVNDGDLIHADHNGVLLIASDYLDAIVEACILSRDFETRAHTFVRRSDKSAEEKLQFTSQLRLGHVARCKKLLE